ncbi:MAG: serine hydrolase [Oceanicaulis sp.]|nr:serine hydrolase [Oceanicaulis sp.]
MRKIFLGSAAIFSLVIAAWFTLAPPRAVTELGFILRHAQLASAYAASELCYGVLLQDRSEADVRASELGPYMDDRLSWFGARIDRERGEVRASLWGLFGVQYGMRADGSCSRGVTGAGQAPVFEAPDPRPWPEGDALHPDARNLVPDFDALAEAVEAEFEPFPSGHPRGTRSVLVIHRGQLVYERHAPGWDRFAPQNGQSNTKVLNSILAGILAGQGRLTLDGDRLRPEWTGERAAIRLRHLLHMESGLDWEESSGAGDSGYAKLVAFSSSDYAAAKPLRDEPGTRFYYSGGDSELAMAILQDRSGLKDDDWARFPYEVLFEPLGMRRTVISRDASGQFIGQGSMYAAATDWARLGMFLARDGVWDGERILPEGWVDFIVTPTDNSRCNYGAQLWIRGGCTGGTPSPVFEMSGLMGQNVTIVPETETVIVRHGYGPWNMGDLLERVFPALGVDAPTRMAMETRN